MSAVSFYTVRRIRSAYRMDDDGENATQTRTARVPAGAMKGLDRRGLHQLAESFDLVPRCGCDCGHCMAGWDCCGRMVPILNRVKRVKRGLKITTIYARNI